jgi:hypothetical protein
MFSRAPLQYSGHHFWWHVIIVEMKYRKGNSKIKYEHGMIAGLQDLLERIESWDEIVSVIPGEIKPAKGSGSGIRLEVKYPTNSGIKTLAKNTEAVQEVFFVTRNPEELKAKLRSLNGPAADSVPVTE